MSDPDRQATFVGVGASDGADGVDREEDVAWAAAARGVSGDEQAGTEARHGAGAIGVDGDTVGEDGGGHLCSAEFAVATTDDLVGCGHADQRTFHPSNPVVRSRAPAAGGRWSLEESNAYRVLCDYVLG